MLSDQNQEMQAGLPKHVQLIDEETDVGVSQNYDGSSESADQKPVKEAETKLILTIQLLSGEHAKLELTDELKQNLISEVKAKAFPAQSSRGCQIRFIYRGRLIKDNERIQDLEFNGPPIIHAQINEPVQPEVAQIAQVQNNREQPILQEQLIHPSQYQTLPIVAAQMNQQNGQAGTVNMDIDMELEGTQCDFWFGFFLVMFLNFVGMAIIFCCNYPKQSKKGAIIAFVIQCIINLVFYRGSDEDDQQY